MSGKQQSPTGRKPLFFLLVTVAIDSLGLGVVIPVWPELMEMFTGNRGLGMAAAWGGVLAMLYAVMQFFFAPVMGSLSDRFGRRPVLLLALTALGFDYLLTGLAPTLIWLFLGRAVAGALGATFSVANAYVADISDAAGRGRYFGYIGAAWSLGFIIGPLLGGVLGEYGPRVPFFVAAGLAMANALYGYFVLPETLPADKRSPFAWKQTNAFSIILGLRTYPVVFVLIMAVVLFQIAHDSLPGTWSYFVAFRLDWGPTEIGYSLAVVGVLTMIVMAVGTPLAISRMGEKRTAILGLIVSGIGFVGLSTVTKGWELYAWLLPWSLMGLIMPSLRSIMSQQVPANAQGKLQGAITGAMSLASIGTPILMTQLFRYFSQPEAVVFYPGAAFLAAGVAMLCCLILVAWGLRQKAVSA